jgi:hypothetical protein
MSSTLTWGSSLFCYGLNVFMLLPEDTLFSSYVLMCEILYGCGCGCGCFVYTVEGGGIHVSRKKEKDVRLVAKI